MADSNISVDIGFPAHRPVAPTPSLPHEVADAARQAIDAIAPHVVDRVVGRPDNEAYAVFMVDAETGQLSIRIVDARTDETIQQFPHEDLVRFAQQTQAYLKAARHRQP